MKKTIKIGLGWASLVALFVLVITHFPSCKTHPAGSPERIVIPVPVWTNDSSSGGSGTGSHPLIIKNPVQWPGGTLLVFKCANKDCAGIAGARGSGADPANRNMIFELRIPYDLPANTEMSLSFRPAPGAK